MKIKAAVVNEVAGPFDIEELELEEPRYSEVLVRITGTGLCHTDLALKDQPYISPPVVYGHEGAGIVEHVGSQVTKVEPGDHVVLTYGYCGVCPACLKGAPGYCTYFGGLNVGGCREDGSSPLRKGDESIHGVFFGQSSFASHALVNERGVVKVRKDVPLELLGPLGCGFQTGAGGVINSLQAKPGSSIAIFGLGSVGLSSIMAAVVCGCTTIIGVDINPERLKLAKELGATHTVNAKEVDPVRTIQEITDNGVEFSLECVGNPQLFRQAVDSLALRGICGLIGSPPFGTEVTFDMLNIMSGRIIRGVIEGDSIPDIFIPQLVELYRQGRFPIDRLITFYKLEEINQAVEDVEKGRVVKAILRP